MTQIYFIGGSPCSGKSTIAEMISKEHALYYFKVDDFLDDYIFKARKKCKPFSVKISNMSPEEIWMRAPEEQNKEEFEIYREIFEFIMYDIEKIDAPYGIITEGAAYLPELVQKIDVDRNHYLILTPTKEFQYLHYKQRSWVPYILEGCSDKDDAAFQNWMERDALFAMGVRDEAATIGYESIVTDGTESIENTLSKVCYIFGMNI